MTISKNEIYLLGNYSLVNFIAINEQEKSDVWKWRNDPSIRRFMYNKEEIPWESHLRFIDGLESREDAYYWLVNKDSVPFGVVDLTGVDVDSSCAELGYYMRPDLQNQGNGLDFVYTLFLFAFNSLGVDNLIGSIDKRNVNAIILDAYLGCILNDEDFKNIDDVDYIRWRNERTSFLSGVIEKNNFRGLVRYMRDNKVFFDTLRKNAA